MPWLKARFEDATGLNPSADVAAFDTRKPREGGQPAGGIFQDVWAATAGTLIVEAGEGGAVRVVATGATMAPDPQGAGYGSQATGSFRLAAEGLAWPRDQREGATPPPTAVPDGLDLNGVWTLTLPGASPTPIPACGTAAYRRYQIADPERDGRDMTVAVDSVQPPMGDAGATMVEGTLAGGLVGDRYEFEGTLTYTSPAGAKTTGREALHLRYDAAAGELVGDREVGAPVEQGARHSLTTRPPVPHLRGRSP